MRRKCISCRHRIPKVEGVHVTPDGVYCYPCMNRIQAMKGRMEKLKRIGEK